MDNNGDHQFLDAELLAIRESVNEAILTTTLDGLITTWNPAAQHIFGYGAQEIVGKPLFRLVPAENQPRHSEILKCLRRSEVTKHYDTQWISKDGGIVEIAVTCTPIFDDVKRVVACLIVCDDVSERRLFELAEHDQLFLSSSISSADDAIVSKDLNGTVTSWNKAAEVLFGYTAEEMIGKSIAILIPENQPDEEKQILKRIRRGERVDHFETKRRRKDGQIIDISVTISPIRDGSGRIIGTSKIARDITEHERLQKAELAESFLSSIVESAEDAIIGKNLNGTVVSWNPAAERLYGYTAAEIIGKPVTILIPPGHPNEEHGILERIRRGERIEHYETTRMRKDGRLVEVAQTLSPVKDTLGQVIGVSNVTRDIMMRKQLEQRERDALQQAREATQKAEDASRAKDEFLANISHELRTPMTAILGWTHMLLEGNLDPERQRKAIGTIDRNARSQAQLIEDLLDIVAHRVAKTSHSA